MENKISNNIKQSIKLRRILTLSFLFFALSIILNKIFIRGRSNLELLQFDLFNILSYNFMLTLISVQIVAIFIISSTDIYSKENSGNQYLLFSILAFVTLITWQGLLFDLELFRTISITIILFTFGMVLNTVALSYTIKTKRDGSQISI